VSDASPMPFEAGWSEADALVPPAPVRWTRRGPGHWEAEIAPGVRGLARRCGWGDTWSAGVWYTGGARDTFATAGSHETAEGAMRSAEAHAREREASL
jgi:hypothetical protein